MNIVDECTLLSKLVKVHHHRGGGEKSSDDNMREYRPITCNPNLRLYKYTKGQWFGRHVDESNKIDVPPRDFDDDQVDGPSFSTVDDRDGMRTEITVLFYLSSCRGGATRFHLPHGSRKKDDSSVAFTPEEGAVLLHVHGDRCLEHEAEPVLEGVKYGEEGGEDLFFRHVLSSRAVSWRRTILILFILRSARFPPVCCWRWKSASNGHSLWIA